MTDNPTLETYNQYAQIYDDEVVAFWENFPKDFVEAFVTGLSPKRVLDVGSGSGRDALLLRDQGCDVVCQDGSESMVRLTNELGFESYLADFTEVDFPAHTFGGVWAYTSLIHIPKAEAAEVIRKLRTYIVPGGVFAIGVIEGESAGMVERSSMPDAARYFKNYSSSELRAMVEPLGFTLVREGRYKPGGKTYIHHLYCLK
jgi:SAM-dependent methyltransferase